MKNILIFIARIIIPLLLSVVPLATYMVISTYWINIAKELELSRITQMLLGGFLGITGAIAAIWFWERSEDWQE